MVCFVDRDSLGLTTKTFMKLIDKKVISHEEILQWAADKGFKWIEVRDNDAGMDKARLEGLLSLAKEHGLRLHYAWDGGDLLTEEDEILFRKGIMNAAVFGSGTCSRITLSVNSFKVGNFKRGYSKEEFDRLCNVILRYEKIAAEHYITIVYENAYESVEGDGKTFFGMRELMNAVPGMKITFDPGNFMNKEQVKTTYRWAEVRDFYMEFKSRIPYIHLKSTKNNVLIEKLAIDGDIDYSILFENSSPIDLFCIELPGIEDLEQCKANIEEAYSLITKK